MSEAKGPYKHYRLCDEAPCVKGNCMACVYEEGRASRDGLARALNDILEGGNDTSAWAFGVAKRALEADGEGE